MTTNPIPTTAGRDACATSAIHNFHLDEDFQRMPPKQQERVKLFAEMMETMHVAILGGAPKNAAAREQAAANAHIDGCSTVNIKKRYYEWLEKGKDWRVLRDRALIQRLASDVDVELIDDLVRKQFFDFYGGFIQQNQRKNAPAYRAFLRHWFSGGKVPGYGTWPEYWTAKGHAYLTKCPTRELPRGWSAENLARLATPPKVELALVRQGISKALQMLPPIPGTRDGLRFLEYVSFDDVKHDKLIIVPGYTKAVELLGIGAMCFGSGNYLRFGLRPRLPSDEDKNRKEALRLSDMKLLAAVMLMDYGWSKDYVSYWLLEHGTATLPAELCRALYELTDGHVVCVFSMMEHGVVTAWDDRAKGNSRAKSWHESWHNLFHNEGANIRGQTGKDRDHAPASLPAMQREAVLLNRAGALMSPDQRARLKLPFTALEEAFNDTREIVNRSNNRIGHSLEGFRRIIEWRLRGTVEWRSQEELEIWLASTGASFDQVHGAGLIELHPNPRLETPMERRRRLCHGIEFVKAPGWVVRRFLDTHKLERVENGAITFDHEGIKHTFWPERIEDALPDYDDMRRKYLCWFVPNMAEFIFITDEHLAYIGRWRRMKLPRFSPEQLAEAIHWKTKLLNTAKANIRRRDNALEEAGTMAQRDADLTVNLRVLADHGLVDETKLLSAPPTGSVHGAAKESQACEAVTPDPGSHEFEGASQCAASGDPASGPRTCHLPVESERGPRSNSDDQESTDTAPAVASPSCLDQNAPVPYFRERSISFPVAAALDGAITTTRARCRTDDEEARARAARKLARQKRAAKAVRDEYA